LIAKNCAVFTSNEKALAWAKFITDLHEECFPNEPFDNQMDLHNNEIGRLVFDELIHLKIHSKKKMIQFLMEKSESAVGLDDANEIRNIKGELVYFNSITPKSFNKSS